MSTIELPEADASKTEQTQARPEDPLGFNDNDSDKTDGNQAAVKEYEVKIEKLTSLVSKMKKALELQTNKTNEKVSFYPLLVLTVKLIMYTKE